MRDNEPINDSEIPEKSAGIIIIRRDENRGPCVLLLKIYSKYDLPKGHIEDDDAGVASGDERDTILNAAIRECYEECGFDVSSDTDAKLSAKRPVARLIPHQEHPIRCVAYDRHTMSPRKAVYLFVAETLCHKAVIRRNKKSGIYEHQGYRWVTESDLAASGLHKYLQGSVMQAFEIFSASERIDEAVRKVTSLTGA